MCHQTKLLHVIFIYLIASLAGFAQDFRVKIFNTSEGICHPFVYTINQDVKGYLWLGTGEGLCRFDGFNFSSSLVNDSLSGQVAMVSYKDTQGHLLFGFNNGALVIYDGQKFKIASPGHEITGAITGIAQLGNQGYLLATLNNGLIFVDNNLSAGKKIEGIQEVMITALCVSGNIVFVGSPDGMSVYEVKKTGQPFARKFSIDELSLIKIQDIQTGMDKKSWLIATQDAGAYKLILNDKSYIIHPIGKEFKLDSEDFQSVFEDTDKNIWLSSLKNGVYKLSAPENEGRYKSIIHLDKSNILPGNAIKRVFEDIEGNIWIATYGEGLVLVLNQAFSFYTYPMPGIENNITAVTSFNDYLWIGGLGTLVKTKPENKTPVITYNRNNGLPVSQITALQGYGENLYIGTENSGVYVLNTRSGSIKKLIYSENSLGNIVQSMLIKNDIIYLGTRDGIYVYSLKTGTKQNYSTLNGMPHNDIKYLYIDKDNRLLFATRTNGIYQITENGDVNIAYRTNRIEQEFNSISQDARGNVWASTYGDGLYLFTPDTFYNFNVTSGLKSNYCYGLIASNNHSIWVGHRMGISRINTQKYTIQVYDVSKGISGDCNFNAMHRNEAGVILFGTTEGLIMYNPSKEKPSKVPPFTNITRVIISDKEYDFTKDILLPYSLYKLRIEFIGLSYSDPAAVKYQYKLEGHDLEWSEITPVNYAIYPRIEDGEYTFLLRSFDNNGLCQDKPLSLHIKVKLPFWKTWWFITSSIAAIILAFIAIIKYREKKQKELQAYLETELAARTKEVVEQKEEIELKNRDITDSITYAQRIQASILPPIKKLQQNFSGCFVFYQPRDIVSGDFYWFDKVNDNKFIIVCADSTGHGVPGAFMSMIGTTLIKDICFREAGKAPSEILKVLDKELSTILNQNIDDGSKPPDGMDIIVCEIDLKTHYLRYAAAMRPLIVYKDGEQMYLKGSHSSVGGVYDKEIKTFQDEGLQLSKGDIIYMFSDGYPDQFGGSLGKKFKMVRLKNMLADIYQKSMEEQYLHVKNTFNLWKENYDQVDDVLFMGIKI